MTHTHTHVHNRGDERERRRRRCRRRRLKEFHTIANNGGGGFIFDSYSRSLARLLQPHIHSGGAISACVF